MADSSELGCGHPRRGWVGGLFWVKELIGWLMNMGVSEKETPELHHLGGADSVLSFCDAC